mmetsp:Transcript_3831/g.11275  ORF Transcript_3831/g.11275 Transcript_3831/m.11275 type:complete len:201 (+) Transcript_3831:183-785(+)
MHDHLCPRARASHLRLRAQVLHAPGDALGPLRHLPGPALDRGYHHGGVRVVHEGSSRLHLCEAAQDHPHVPHHAAPEDAPLPFGAPNHQHDDCQLHDVALLALQPAAGDDLRLCRRADAGRDDVPKAARGRPGGRLRGVDALRLARQEHVHALQGHDGRRELGRHRDADAGHRLALLRPRPGLHLLRDLFGAQHRDWCLR